MEKFYSWLAWKLSWYIADHLQAGGRCGLCGNWCKYDVVHISWPYTLCNSYIQLGKVN